MPSQKVVNIFRHYLVESSGNIDDALKKLLEESKSCAKDVDNITIQVIVFGTKNNHSESFVELGR